MEREREEEKERGGKRRVKCTISPYEGVQLAWYIMRLWHPSLASHTDDFGRDGYMFQGCLS